MENGIISCIFAAVSKGKRMPSQMFIVLTDVCHLSVFYEQTNRNYLFANGQEGLNELNGLAHLWVSPIFRAL